MNRQVIELSGANRVVLTNVQIETASGSHCELGIIVLKPAYSFLITELRVRSTRQEVHKRSNSFCAE